MNWVIAILLSAFFLGLYDLCTKHAVRANAVTPVLFFSTLTGATVWFILLLVQAIRPGLLPHSLVTDALTWKQHLQLLLKSAIVAASWVGSYFALKHLPLSLGAPIRATSPLFTLFGAILILGERPTGLETVGILTTLGSFVGLSVAGARRRAFSPQQMGVVNHRRHAARRGEFALRQVSAGHAEFFRADGAMLVPDLSAGVFRAVRARLETAAVAAQ
jgi:drug/metabolite transporter (DMT)-like permease